MQFSPCRGGDHCTQDGTHCEGCGRSREEIIKTQMLVGQIVQFAQQMGYENVEDFTRFVADKATKKVHLMRE